ncbi:unnamed protein product [Sphagnum troendelagicum]|uniref:GRAM domain-containing protein n=1 Tax=Sphagnum troendelagicum TaxID=128251 RepID=A0ABP0UI81_9BRYO
MGQFSTPWKVKSRHPNNNNWVQVSMSPTNGSKCYRSSDYVPYPQVETSDVHEGQGSPFGAPPMGEPAEPSSHPDNRAAAEQTTAAPEELASGPMNLIVENLNKWAAKAEGLAGNVWGHLRVGPSVTETAWGRMTHGTRLLTEGGFEGVYKQTFGMATNEQLRKTYACYLSTSTGPVAGTLYITNLKFAFCSDRPLSYAPVPGQVAWSYYKVVIPLEKVREVVPSVNENKQNEKYIQLVTTDGHEFWFMGFVNYDKGVMNMQDALRNIGVVDPQGGLKSRFGGNRNREVPQQTGSSQGYVTPSQENPAPSN